MLALATAGCLWGTGFFFGKIALSEMPVTTMVLSRFAFACTGLLPFIFFDRPRFAGSDWGWVLAASVVGTLPMLLAIAAVLFSGERLHLGGWLALVASTVGSDELSGLMTNPLAMKAAFFQGLGLARIGGNSLHYGQGEVEQFAGAKYVGHRVSHPGTVVRPNEKIVNDFREEAIGPVCMHALPRGIEFLHLAPNPVAILHDGHLIMRDSLAWNVGDMFNVVEKGHGIVIGAQQHDLAIEHHESFQRRT